MNITELIAKLEAVRAVHGDLPVYFHPDPDSRWESELGADEWVVRDDGKPDRVHRDGRWTTGSPLPKRLTMIVD